MKLAINFSDPAVIAEQMHQFNYGNGLRQAQIYDPSFDLTHQ
jgi:hypothetical protein